MVSNCQSQNIRRPSTISLKREIQQITSRKRVKDIITKLSKTFSNRYRLSIMSMLMVNDWVDYKHIKDLMPDLSDGNLANHIKHLEKQKYLEVRKQFIGKKPNTSYTATSAGREAFKEHLDALEALIKKSK